MAIGINSRDARIKLSTVRSASLLCLLCCPCFVAHALFVCLLCAPVLSCPMYYLFCVSLLCGVVLAKPYPHIHSLLHLVATLVNTPFSHGAYYYVHLSTIQTWTRLVNFLTGTCCMSPRFCWSTERFWEHTVKKHIMRGLLVRWPNTLTLDQSQSLFMFRVLPFSFFISPRRHSLNPLFVEKNNRPTYRTFCTRCLSYLMCHQPFYPRRRF